MLRLLVLFVLSRHSCFLVYLKFFFLRSYNKRKRILRIIFLIKKISLYKKKKKMKILYTLPSNFNKILTFQRNRTSLTQDSSLYCVNYNRIIQCLYQWISYLSQFIRRKSGVRVSSTLTQRSWYSSRGLNSTTWRSNNSNRCSLMTIKRRDDKSC